MAYKFQGFVSYKKSGREEVQLRNFSLRLNCLLTYHLWNWTQLHICKSTQLPRPVWYSQNNKLCEVGVWLLKNFQACGEPLFITRPMVTSKTSSSPSSKYTKYHVCRFIGLRDELKRHQPLFLSMKIIFTYMVGSSFTVNDDLILWNVLEKVLSDCQKIIMGRMIVRIKSPSEVLNTKTVRFAYSSKNGFTLKLSCLWKFMKLVLYNPMEYRVQATLFSTFYVLPSLVA